MKIDEIKNELISIDALLANIPAAGDNLMRIAAARTKLLTVSQLLEKEEKDDGASLND